jgi:hypothetical protein
VVEKAVFSYRADRAEAIVILYNPNPHVGLARFVYTFVFRDAAGQEVGRSRGEDYILPSERKFVVAFDVPVRETPREVDFRWEELNWIPTPDDFPAPRILLVSRRSRYLPGNPPRYEIKADLFNESTVDYQRVEVVAVGYDEQGKIIGAGKTFAGALRSRERREFTASWPLPYGRKVARTVAIPTVNLFREDAIIERYGPLVETRYR